MKSPWTSVLPCCCLPRKGFLHRAAARCHPPPDVGPSHLHHRVLLHLLPSLRTSHPPCSCLLCCRCNGLRGDDSLPSVAAAALRRYPSRETEQRDCCCCCCCFQRRCRRFPFPFPRAASGPPLRCGAQASVEGSRCQHPRPCHRPCHCRRHRRQTSSLSVPEALPSCAPFSGLAEAVCARRHSVTWWVSPKCPQGVGKSGSG